MTSSVPSPFDAFPTAVREDLDGLLWLGFIEERFSFCGHTFTVRTLRGDEELLAGLAMKDYIETLGQAKAHVWSTVALALTEVDGSTDFCPQASTSKQEYAHARFRWATSHWYWPVALYIYNKYTDLLRRQNEALEALEDFCSGSLPTFMPFASSSTDKAPSTEPEEDIREYLEPPEGSTPSS